MVVVSIAGGSRRQLWELPVLTLSNKNHYVSSVERSCACDPHWLVDLAALKVDLGSREDAERVLELTERVGAALAGCAAPPQSLQLVVSSVDDAVFFGALLSAAAVARSLRSLNVTVRVGSPEQLHDTVAALFASLGRATASLTALQSLELCEVNTIASVSGAPAVAAWPPSALVELAALLRRIPLERLRLCNLAWDDTSDGVLQVVAAVEAVGGTLRELGVVGMAALARRVVVARTALGKMTSLVQLDLSHSRLGDVVFAELVRQLTVAGTWDRLRGLGLAQCELGEHAVKALRDAHAGSFALAHLDFSGNTIHDTAAFMLSTILMRCPELAALDLRHNRMTARAVADVGSSLRGAAGLRSLCLRSNRLQDGGLQAVLQCAAQWPALEVLDLGRCRLTAACLPSLSAALPSCEQLRVLKLSGNDLRALEPPRHEGAGAGAGSAEGDIKLFAYDHKYMQNSGRVPTSFELDRKDREANRVRFTGTEEFRHEQLPRCGDVFKELGEALGCCRQLRVLELDDTVLGDSSLVALMEEGHLSAPRLRELRLCANPLLVSESAVRALGALLWSTPELELLDLSFTGLGDLGLAALCDGESEAERGVLTTLAGMRDLRLAHCGLKGLGLEALAAAVSCMPELRTLTINSNPTEDTRWVDELLHQLAQLPHFQCLVCAGVLRDERLVRGTPSYSALTSRGVQVLL